MDETPGVIPRASRMEEASACAAGTACKRLRSRTSGRVLGIEWHEGVARSRYGKQQVAVTHLGRRPERQEESQVDGVADALIERARRESNRFLLFTAHVKPYLPQAKRSAWLTSIVPSRAVSHSRARRPRSNMSASIIEAATEEPAAPESMDFRTKKLPTNPMAQRNVTKKIRYAISPYGNLRSSPQYAS